MAHILQVAMLVALMSLTYCSAQDAQGAGEQVTLVSSVGRRALLGDISYDRYAKSLPKYKCEDRASYKSCYDWKYKGWCNNKYYKYFSVAYYWCPKTCKKCSCYDQPSYAKKCKDWYYKGYCKKGYYYTYYGKKYSIYYTLCAKTCKYCY